MLTLFLYCLLLFAFWILLVRKVPKKIDSILNYLYFGSVTKGDLMLVAISFSYCQHLFKHIEHSLHHKICLLHQKKKSWAIPELHQNQ